MNEPCNCCEGPMLVTCEDCEGEQWEFNVLAIPALVETADGIGPYLQAYARSEENRGRCAVADSIRHAADELSTALAEVKARLPR